MNALMKREKEELMVEYNYLPEELRYIPDGSDLEECIEYVKKVAFFIRGSQIEGKYVWGKTFQNIKKMLGHGKWLEACTLIGISRFEAELHENCERIRPRSFTITWVDPAEGTLYCLEAGRGTSTVHRKRHCLRFIRESSSDCGFQVNGME